MSAQSNSADSTVTGNKNNDKDIRKRLQDAERRLEQLGFGLDAVDEREFDRLTRKQSGGNEHAEPTKVQSPKPDKDKRRVSFKDDERPAVPDSDVHALANRMTELEKRLTRGFDRMRELEEACKKMAGMLHHRDVALVSRDTGTPDSDDQLILVKARNGEQEYTLDDKQVELLHEAFNSITFEGASDYVVDLYIKAWSKLLADGRITGVDNPTKRIRTVELNPRNQSHIHNRDAMLKQANNAFTKEVVDVCKNKKAGQIKRFFLDAQGY